MTPEFVIPCHEGLRRRNLSFEIPKFDQPKLKFDSIFQCPPSYTVGFHSLGSGDEIALAVFDAFDKL